MANTDTKSTIDRSLKIQAASDAFGAELDNETVLMSIAKGNYFVLNPVAGEIWNILHEAEEPVSFGEIVDSLSARFDGDPQVIERDIARFVEGLIAKGLATAA